MYMHVQAKAYITPNRHPMRLECCKCSYKFMMGCRSKLYINFELYKYLDKQNLYKHLFYTCSYIQKSYITPNRHPMGLESCNWPYKCLMTSTGWLCNNFELLQNVEQETIFSRFPCKQPIMSKQKPTLLLIDIQ